MSREIQGLVRAPPRHHLDACGDAARGAMGMVVASVTLQAGVIGPPVFVALIVMALVTSMISGPAIGALLNREAPAGARPASQV